MNQPPHGNDGDASRQQPRLAVNVEGKRLLLNNLATTVTSDMLPAAPATASSLRSVLETSDQLPGVQRAVEKAVTMGIVREEIFPAQVPTDQRAYLLSSSHYGTFEYDPVTTNPDKKRTQAELFRLMYLLMQEGFQGPVFVEGRDMSQTYTAFRGRRPTVIVAGKQHDIHDIEAQTALFQNPDLLISIMDTQQREAQRTRSSTPIFYQYSAYKNICGAHTPATDKLVVSFCKLVEWEHGFAKKYAFFFESLQIANDQTQVTIDSGWDGLGTPHMCLANRWISAREFIQDAEQYLQYANALHELDMAREQEMSALLTTTATGIVPMAFAGKAHEFAVAERVTKQKHLHVLTPQSSTHLDHTRRRHPVNDPRCKILRVDLMQKMLAFAKSIQPRTS